MRFDIRPRIRRAFRLALRRRDLSEREIEEELRAHVALRADHLMAQGLTPVEAEQQALRRLEAPGTMRSRVFTRPVTRVMLACACENGQMLPGGMLATRPARSRASQPSRWS